MRAVGRMQEGLQRRVEARRHSAAWEGFYARHRANFFKDRHYLEHEHAALRAALAERGRVVRVLDWGCGVGNAILPLLAEAEARVEYLGLDVSQTAVDILADRLGGYAGRVAFLVRALDLAACSQAEWDRCLGDFADALGPNRDGNAPQFDFCLMIFVLSALHPRQMLEAVQRPCACLRPGGGRLLFRDYMRGDLAEKRFNAGQRLGRGLFMRQDGTLSFFFTPDGLSSLFETELGLCKVFVKEVRRLVENKAEGLQMERVWIGAEFVRPQQTST